MNFRIFNRPNAPHVSTVSPVTAPAEAVLAPNTAASPATPLAERIEAGVNSNASDVKLQEDLELVRAARLQLTEEMKAVDTRAGSLIVLAVTVTLASLSGLAPGWKYVFLGLSAAAVASSLVALLAKTVEGQEPGLKLIYARLEGPEDPGTALSIELRWLKQFESELRARKRWLLGSYIVLVASGVALAIGFALKYLIHIFG